MDLDSAMLTLARLYARSRLAVDLTAAVRSGVLAALDGRLPDGLSPHESVEWSIWLEQERSCRTDPAGSLYQKMLGRIIDRDETGAPVIRHERRQHRATGAYYTGEVVVQYLLDRVIEFVPDAVSLIDPACGTGAFLEAACQRVPQLVGLDADPVALALCRQRVPQAELYRADALLDLVPGGFDLVVGNPPYISSGLRGAPEASPLRLSMLRRRYSETAQYKLNTYPLFIQRGF